MAGRLLPALALLAAAQGLLQQRSGAVDDEDGAELADAPQELDEAPLQESEGNLTHRFNPRTDHILVYQHGKVASTSLSFALGGTLRPPRRLDYVKTLQRRYPRGGKVHQWAVAKDMLARRPRYAHTWVITVVRNPFIRTVSTFFQMVDKTLTQAQVLNMSIAELHKLYRQSFGRVPSEHFYQGEFMQATGVNLTQYADRFRKGHIFLQEELREKRMTIILLRYEEIEFWEDILRPYFPGFKMVKANVGATKWYKEQYKQFLDTYRFSQAEVGNLLTYDDMAFYRKNEQAVMIQQASARHLPVTKDKRALAFATALKSMWEKVDDDQDEQGVGL